MNAVEFSELLKDLQACSEARKWAKEKSLVEVWQQCERGDWLLWLCARMIGKPGWPSHQQVVLAACSCAEQALKYIREGEDRPRQAIETAKKWARGEAGILQLRQAYAADAAAAAAYAADAAAAAAYAADAAYAAAAYAADAAAYAADAAAARRESLKSSASIVRLMLAVPDSEGKNRVLDPSPA